MVVIRDQKVDTKSLCIMVLSMNVSTIDSIGGSVINVDWRLNEL